MDPTLIPILVPLGVFAMIFGLRYFENKERMAMIEKGMTRACVGKSLPVH